MSLEIIPLTFDMTRDCCPLTSFKASKTFQDIYSHKSSLSVIIRGLWVVYGAHTDKCHDISLQPSTTSFMASPCLDGQNNLIGHYWCYRCCCNQIIGLWRAPLSPRRPMNYEKGHCAPLFNGNFGAQVSASHVRAWWRSDLIYSRGRDVRYLSLFFKDRYLRVNFWTGAPSHIFAINGRTFLLYNMLSSTAGCDCVTLDTDRLWANRILCVSQYVQFNVIETAVVQSVRKSSTLGKY